METAYLGGGCFWCVEAVLERLKGVQDVTSGYMGGASEHPTYEQVSRGDSGHVEVVRVVFDPSIVSFETILTVFFATHDPTTLNKQGNDVGEQYRSVIFAVNQEQAAAAHAKIVQLEADQVYERPIVTAVEPATTFYEVESYHQDYYRQNIQAGYCSVVISPKVAKLRKEFAHLLQENDPE